VKYLQPIDDDDDDDEHDGGDESKNNLFESDHITSNLIESAFDQSRYASVILANILT
jgi:hypothetical protein